MGAWGTAIMSDDLACDVRDEFRELIGDGKSAEEVTSELLVRHRSSVEDPDEGPVFWMALALVQWNSGRLQVEVKSRALRIIESGEALRRWRGDAVLLKKREKAVRELGEKLRSRQPSPKRIKKQFSDDTPYRIGDVLGYRTAAGKFVLFRVIGHHEDRGGRSPVCELLDCYSDTMPEPGRIESMKLMKSRENTACTSFIIGSVSEKEFKGERVQVVARNSVPLKEKGRQFVFLWKTLDRQLDEFFGVQ